MFQYISRSANDLYPSRANILVDCVLFMIYHEGHDIWYFHNIIFWGQNWRWSVFWSYFPVDVRPYDALHDNLHMSWRAISLQGNIFTVKLKVDLKSLKLPEDAITARFSGFGYPLVFGARFWFRAVSRLVSGHILSARHLKATNLNPEIKDTFL